MGSVYVDDCFLSDTRTMMLIRRLGHKESIGLCVLIVKLYNSVGPTITPKMIQMAYSAKYYAILIDIGFIIETLDGLVLEIPGMGWEE